VTTSKTQQVCDTSLIFEVGNIENDAILRDFPQFEADNIKNYSARLPSKMER
jgi:hypothetical protein